MKTKASPKRAPRRNEEGIAIIRENGSQIKQKEKPYKPPSGRGLGKAGAKRLGRLLKRAIQQQQQEEEPGKQKSLPLTPVRLLKYQIQLANNAPMPNTTKHPSPQVSKVILSVVSECKRNDGISMAELKQTLAAEGFNVTNKQVKVVKRVVISKPPVQTPRNESMPSTTNTCTDIEQIKVNPVTPDQPTEELAESTTAHRSPKRAEKVQKTEKTAKPKGRSHTAKGKNLTVSKTHRKSTKSHRKTTKSHKKAVKSHKKPPKSHRKSAKTRKSAVKPHNQRTQTTRLRRTTIKIGGKKRRSAKNQPRPSRKSLRRAEWRRQAKRSQHSYKSTRKRRVPR